MSLCETNEPFYKYKWHKTQYSHKKQHANQRTSATSAGQKLNNKQLISNTLKIKKTHLTTSRTSKA
jgi:hypothetical protein